MNQAPVTIVSCFYGTTHDKFLYPWAASIRKMDPQPADVILATENGVREDPKHPVWSATIYGVYPEWKHLQAQLLNYAIERATTEWVWILDIDDQALPDALEGIQDVQADVWQMGYERDGDPYAVPQLTGYEYLNQPGNPFTAGSAIRTDAFQHVGGFSDIAFQDWGLWRKLAMRGAIFQSSGRAHYVYNRHDQTRSAVELTNDNRSANLADMYYQESIVDLIK